MSADATSDDAPTLTVYLNNNANRPTTLHVRDVAEKVRESGYLDAMLPDQAINRRLAEIGAFDPTTDEYQAFERAVYDRLKTIGAIGMEA
jgi:hypothetical protein